MSAVTVAPTAEAANHPPRVRLDVTDTGSPAITSVTVTRLDPDGQWRPVRTPDGAPLTLVTSGSNRVGTVYDYETPFGAPVAYSTEESPAAVSAEVTVDADQVWLIHPSVPALSMPVELRADSFSEETWGVEQGILWPMGREYPVVQTDGIRKAPLSSLTVAIETPQQLAALRSLLRDAAVLLLNVPGSLGLGVATSYVAVGAVRNRRLSDIGADPNRDVELPIQMVERPVGGTQAARTYADLLDHATYADLAAAYSTYAELLAGP